MRRSAALVVVALAAGLLSGCAPGPVSELPAGVSVGVQQNRDDYGPRRLEVLVTNTADEPLDVWEARLDSPAFTDPAATDGPTTVRPGTTTALRLQLAPPDCADPGADARVRLAFTQGGVSGMAVVAPDDPLGSLPRIHAEDCLAQRVAEVVSIVPGDVVTVAQEGGQPVAHLPLTLTPTGADGGVSIASVGRTILLRPASGQDSWPVGVRMDAGAATTRVDLAIVPNNCNTHTVSEDKRGTFFPVAVTLDDGTSGVVAVGVSDAVRGALYRFIAEDSCRWR
ncbi:MULTISPECIES: hypothetical protein [unclassified Rathayibacter]|uniref:hypothetical protein n=1 Tax=unclassified Rathayibacter TaxID=2609250 RepID=UPI00104DB426|nr:MULTISPECIES: hypothetical protein [unclassified Rathayibacter]TCL84873.1 hypothetical protein EDF49_102547 [Rathayibacter sp. PhB192]TCM30591.1 hypothetical protein EDF43_102547 [Rathayibacter sp. PhB179]